MDARPVGVCGGRYKFGLAVVIGFLVLLDLGQLIYFAEGKDSVTSGVENECVNIEVNFAACCRALAIANDEGCFCGGPPEHWLLSTSGLCAVEVLTYGSPECASLEASSLLSFLPKSLSWPSKQAYEENDASRHSALSVPSRGPYIDAPEGEEVGSSDQLEKLPDVEDLPVGAPRGVLVGLGGLLLSCAFWCPCWHRKRQEHVIDVDSQGMMTPIASNSPSLSLGTYSTGGSFSTAGNPQQHSSIVRGSNFHFTMADIIRATDNFSPSRKIGQGGFGLVYKGRLPDDQLVAIKRAKKDAFEARLSVEFQTEVESLSQVEHLNLVKLIGYLEENQERILVVEYVNNGNLREHLDANTGAILDIGKRLDIAIDVAHALTYLHTYSDRPIIHRDVKSSNILLTNSYRAKVADFGFSRIGPEDAGATHVSTQVKGTAGYLDPEYLNSYQLTQKSDVYSYGILLIEIFSGRRPIEMKRASDEKVTVRWAWKKVSDGDVAEILDPKLPRTPPALVMVEKVAELAFACSAPSRNDRPLMADAVKQLWSIRTEYQNSIKEYGSARSASNMSTISTVSMGSKTDGRYDPSMRRSQR